MTMWTQDDFHRLCPGGLIGMIHLRALPGSPGWAGSLAAVREAALADADNLVAGGAGALMLENYHDVPFLPERVPPVTIAAMTDLAGAVRRRHPGVPLGINVLRNDAGAALAVAVVTGASFIRVNVHAGAAATDQGPLIGAAWRTLRLRRELGADVGILADVRVKHARPLVERPLAEEAQDLRLRGLADAVIVTGPATGSGTDPAEVAAVRAALPGCPVLVGSGVTAASVSGFVPAADGFIVGSSLKEETAAAGLMISRELTRRLVDALAHARGGKGAA